VKCVLLIWLAMLCWVSSTPAHAHERSESTSHWTFDNGELHGIVTARTREVTRLTVPGDSYASLAQIFSAHVQRSIAASVDGVPCTLPQSPSSLESKPGYLRVDVRMRCGPGNRLTLKLELFFAVAPSHHHFLYVESPGSSREAILTASTLTTQLDLRPTGANETRFLQFVGMGIEHIATGFDHLAFLLALLISARAAREVLAIVTGFTLGHSLTLSLAVLGVIQADRGAVECLIGLTIALAAARNLIRGEREGRIAALTTVAITAALLLIPPDLRPSLPAALIIAIALTTGSAVWLAGAREREFSIPSRTILAMGFGWIHGLGFASALQDLHLPRSRLVSTLLGFNVGVEIGQLLAVLTAIALMRIVATIVPAARQRSGVPATVASAMLLAAGLAWFLTRAIAQNE
jgi:HupE/UreJ protein